MSGQRKPLSTRLWMILLGAVFAALAIAALALRNTPTKQNAVARVYADGALVWEIDLSTLNDTQTFEWVGDRGANTIEARHGMIRVAQADCPDQVCVRQGWLSSGLTPIVCLPHRLVIELDSAAPAPEIDAIS